MRSQAVVAIVALAAAGAIVLARDPEETAAVVAFIIAVAVACGALAALVLLRRRRGQRRPARARTIALRRSVEVGAVVAALLVLRVVDGLSPATALFVVVAFAAAEAVLVARPAAPSR